jgi:hypothetical protein
MKRPKEDAWAEARRRCRLSDEDVRMARELGFQPRSLVKNIPSPSQPWKAPVSEWVRSLYAEKIGVKGLAVVAPPTPAKQPRVIEFRNPDHPWPDRPEIPELVVYQDFDPLDDEAAELEPEGFPFHDPFHDHFEPPSEADVAEEHSRMLRRQCLFRWAAHWVAIAMSELPEVRKVAAFGAVARPLGMEIPRFREFRRHQMEIPHECGDLDLAVWTADLSRLRELKRALSLGLSEVQNTPYGGVAHHQVDVHVFDAAGEAYRGRLCAFGQCPKPRKCECLVAGCGAKPFLQQLEKYRFSAARFAGEPRVVLFDRTSGFIVRPPRMDAKPARIVYRARESDPEWDDSDVPF